MAETKIPSPSDGAEIARREQVVAKIERGLADAEAGRVLSQEEVLQHIAARYPERPRR